ncbi:hypothetical protein J6590_018416 [Homalodisca vitripennis]|nr:hypothetical protein J6590_018416 [Homalodisca vitripennis]
MVFLLGKVDHWITPEWGCAYVTTHNAVRAGGLRVCPKSHYPIFEVRHVQGQHERLFMKPQVPFSAFGNT